MIIVSYQRTKLQQKFKISAIQRASVGRCVGSKAHGFLCQSKKNKTVLKIKEENNFIFFFKNTYVTVV